MGCDAEIYFRAKEGAKVFVDLPKDRLTPTKIVRIGDKDDFGYEIEGPLGATHVVQNDYCFYGPGYERGPWPSICAILMQLLMSSDVEVVWYDGDSTPIEKMKPLEINRVLKISEHYMRNGHEPYEEAFRSQPMPSTDQPTAGAMRAADKAFDEAMRAAKWLLEMGSCCTRGEVLDARREWLARIAAVIDSESGLKEAANALKATTNMMDTGGRDGFSDESSGWEIGNWDACIERGRQALARVEGGGE